MLLGKPDTCKQREPNPLARSAPAMRLQVHSFRNQVRFTEAAKHLPENAVLIEIGPHAILRSALRQNRPSLPYIALMRRGECGLGTVAAAVSEMWRKGLPIQWPTDPVSSKDKRTDGRPSAIC